MSVSKVSKWYDFETMQVGSWAQALPMILKHKLVLDITVSSSINPTYSRIPQYHFPG